MKPKTNSNFKRGITNFFGGLGYLSVVMQWLWVVLLYFSVLQTFVTFVAPNANHQVAESVQPVANFEPNIFLTILTVIIVAAVLALTFYLIFKVPITIVKTSKKVVRQTAETTAPLIFEIQHKKETKKARLKLTSTLIMIIKVLIIFLPIILTFTSQSLDKQSFDFNVALIISLGSAGCSLIFFAFQYSLARLFKISRQEIW